MDVVPPGRTIAQRQFVVWAGQPRVWDLLAMVTYQQLPFEQVDIVSLNRFYAVWRWGIGFIRFPFYVEGKLVDTSRPNSYGCVILVRKGPIRASIKVIMLLRAIGEGQTEVSCTATEEGKKTLVGVVLRRFERGFALRTFDSIGARLQRLCS